MTEGHTDGHMDGPTNNLYENSDHYLPTCRDWYPAVQIKSLSRDRSAALQLKSEKPTSERKTFHLEKPGHPGPGKAKSPKFSVVHDMIYILEREKSIEYEYDVLKSLY